MTPEPELAEAARFEAEFRERKYPVLVANGLSAEDATVDYQAWVLILCWLSGGRFVTIEQGGAEGRTRVGWAECDAAAQGALAALTVDAEKAAADPKAQDKAARLWQRRADVSAIARLVSLRRESIDDLNAHFQSQHGTVGVDGRRNRELAA